ncbi:MAG: hypothetical protein M1839_000407 [Geoglossum umbratile]|nr:MAG: hypothetical protein M1839_000407 [Geoglossum umbratile]
MSIMEPFVPTAVLLEGNNNPPGIYTHAPPKRPKPQLAPQDIVDKFWSAFRTKTPGKVFTILPHNYYVGKAAAARPVGAVPGRAATTSFEEAVNICRAKVEKISKECRRVNQKYRDTHFDIEYDLRTSERYPGTPRFCLDGLDAAPKDVDDPLYLRPRSVKRIEDVFEAPKFLVDGATAGDVKQGRDGDCWFMAAIATLSNMKGLIEKICVARDEGKIAFPVGVYGFVFHRDGEWISTIIDDKLYLTKPDYDDPSVMRDIWDDRERLDGEEEYRKTYQTGSGALYFAQCRDPNETWLPLLEKAYAKAHGDYAAIEGGWVGEGIEDLTGGVTSELYTSDILDKENFWTEELMKVNEEFLFGCTTGLLSGGYGYRKGIVESHAYSIMKAKEIDGQRLLLLRNPWGYVEWNGPWSDGSKEWTPEWMKKLQHRFGDDGAFWISYKDMLRKYQHFDRTRLFGPEWTVTQQWATLTVPWTVAYHDTKFEITLTKESPVVIVLAQLDDRYFRGLGGQYYFKLQFRVHREGERDYLVRSHGSYYMRRSVSTELNLEAGKYLVLVKVTADRNEKLPSVEQVVRDTCRHKRDKLLQIGLSYDLAHARAQIEETDEQKKQREERERRGEEAERKKKKAEIKAERAKMREKERRRRHRERERAARVQKKRELREAAQKAQALKTESERDATDKVEKDLAKTGDGENNEKNGVVPRDVEWREQQIINGLRNCIGSPPARTLTVPEVSSNFISPSRSPASILSELSSDPDSEPEIDDDDLDAFFPPPSQIKLTPGGPTASAPSVEPDDPDPWNAVCVVGLRVYTKDTEVSVQVITPKEHDEASLDVDDLAADAAKVDVKDGLDGGEKPVLNGSGNPR